MSHWCVVCNESRTSRKFSDSFHLRCECGRVAHKMCAKTWRQTLKLEKWICPISARATDPNFTTFSLVFCSSCKEPIVDHRESVDCSLCKAPVHSDKQTTCCSLNSDKNEDFNASGHNWLCKLCRCEKTTEVLERSPEETKEMLIATLNANCTKQFSRKKLCEFLDQARPVILFGQEWWGEFGQKWLEPIIPQHIAKKYRIVGSGSLPSWLNNNNHEAAILWREDQLFDKDDSPKLEVFEHTDKLTSLKNMQHPIELVIKDGINRLVMAEFCTSQNETAPKLLVVSWHGFTNFDLSGKSAAYVKEMIYDKEAAAKEKEKLGHVDKLLEYVNKVAEKREVKNILLCGDFNTDIHCLFYGFPRSLERSGFRLASTKSLYMDIGESPILGHQKDFILYKGPNIKVHHVEGKKLDSEMEHSMIYFAKVSFPVHDSHKEHSN